jgi:hypothetical protein
MTTGVSIPPSKQIDLLVDEEDCFFLAQFGEYIKDLMYFSPHDSAAWKRERFQTAVRWAEGKLALPVLGKKLTMDQAIKRFLGVKPEKDIYAMDRILDTRAEILGRVKKFRQQRNPLDQEVCIT